MDLHKIKSFFKARNTLMEMLVDRGNEIPEKYEISFEEFMIQYENNEVDIPMVEIKTYVYFHIAEKNLAKKDFVNLIENIKKDYEDEMHIIIITPNKLNQSLNKEMKKMNNCESFLLKTLQFNITKHVLIPEMRILAKEEYDGVVEKFRTPINKLPKFLITDPIVQYYGAKSGDLFEIKRISTGSGINVSYRYVK